ncbi:ABC transporter substrate-binding protein [Streptomyces purpurascens]|uniref:Sugar ABC transporter substrate-binding protein n=1 Tax=Streptomyces purpurascens TaxID=1924 RepID=A0ABZ1MTL4_STREF|nr:sugar ABC transporter substrate-binding protein [Streptomyces purpurascens]MCE7046112.1 sugar ABC transporter substrate-binding protein [Streptomyces purpurascens]GGZ98745.1 sugar ABC transporter substrate-binding protein [Streptomyces purpurascens]
MKRSRLAQTAMAATAVLGLVLAGCGDTDPPRGEQADLTVLAMDAPQVQTLKKLTKEHFTAETGITVDYTLLPENEARERMNREFATQAGNYDVASLSAYEVPIYADNGWLAPLDSYVKADEDFDQADVFPNLVASLTGQDGKVYAEPFYGEGSFLMYRKDLFRKDGLVMPPNPTWKQVADLAARIDGTDGTSGICLRGLPGWGQNLAPINTVVNTFGGAWYDMDWNARLTSPEFKKAVGFYVDLVRSHGQPGADRMGVMEILDRFVEGKCAMMYDATSLASSIEADGSSVKGKVGYVPAPHDRTDKAGWLWTWAWGVQKASDDKDAAWEFISWASSKEYQDQVGQEMGWTSAPAGNRKSLYSNPEYQQAAGAWYRQEYSAATDSADPKSPGVGPRPYTGIGFLGIPEFAVLGTAVSQQIASAIAGQQSVDTALEKAQDLAQAAAAKYRGE